MIRTLPGASVICKTVANQRGPRCRLILSAGDNWREVEASQVIINP